MGGGREGLSLRVASTGPRLRRRGACTAPPMPGHRADRDAAARTLASAHARASAPACRRSSTHVEPCPAGAHLCIAPRGAGDGGVCGEQLARSRGARQRRERLRHSGARLLRRHAAGRCAGVCWSGAVCTDRAGPLGRRRCAWGRAGPRRRARGVQAAGTVQRSRGPVNNGDGPLGASSLTRELGNRGAAMMGPAGICGNGQWSTPSEIWHHTGRSCRCR